MKNSIFYLVLIFILNESCNRKKVPEWTSLNYGFIYSNIDSTPFRNVQFKTYKYTASQSKTEEDYFMTDSNGHFEFSTNVIGGLLVWPSYQHGAAYIGPPHFGDPKSYSTDNSTRIYKNNYGTLYTAPYH